MNVITHALAPVVLTRLCIGWRKPQPRRTWLLIGLAGALPDLLNPHLSLEARMTSWSHGIPFWAGFSVLLLVVSLCTRKRLPPWLALLMSAAYLFHLFCDAISGGLNLLYPARDLFWGEYWVPPWTWAPLDVLFTLVTYTLFRILPSRRKTSPTQPESQPEQS
jgi:hypothetical protein